MSAVIPSGAPAAVLDWLKRYPWLPWAVLVIAIVLAICCSSCSVLSQALVAALAVLGGGLYLFRRFAPVGDRRASLPNHLSRPDRLPRASPAIPTSSNFVLSAPGSTFVPTLGGADSPTGTRFNTALAQSFQLNAAGNVAAQHPLRWQST